MKNVLIIHDISGFGKCSTTVALPIISACGSTGTILPTSILSTHTGPQFPGFTFLDLFDNMKATVEHWESLGIQFDALYTGYLGNVEHVDFILNHIPALLKKDAVVFIDPVFADNGELYTGFDIEYAKAQLKLVGMADYVFPNLSEASLMLGLDYKQINPADSQDVRTVLEELQKAGAKNAILTGVRQGDQIGASLLTSDEEIYSSWAGYIDQAFHGTGDVFGSVLVGEYMKQGDIYKAIDKAVDFVPQAIKATLDDPNPIDYGVHFEKCLHLLTDTNKA